MPPADGDASASDDGATSSARVACSDRSSKEVVSYAGAVPLALLAPRNIARRGWSTVWVPLRDEHVGLGWSWWVRVTMGAEPVNAANIQPAAVHCLGDGRRGDEARTGRRLDGARGEPAWRDTAPGGTSMRTPVGVSLAR